MHRVLLIDDEPLVRMTIKSLGPWEKYGFEMAGEAHDGVDALDKLKTEKSFDIILTDISMPKMNGIEVIRQIRKWDDQIPILVLSAFNDYPFVREAFMLGIQDYILKSELNFESLLKLMQKSSDLISAAKQNHEEQRSNNVYLKQKFLENLLNGLIPNDIDNKIAAYQIQLTKANLNVSILSVDNYKVMEDKYDSVVLSNINLSILNVFNQKTSEFKMGELIVIGKGKYALISSVNHENSMAVVHRKLSYFLNNMKQALFMFLNISVTIGVSGTQNGYLHIPSLYAQALAANELKLIYGKGKIIYEHDLSQIENTSHGNLTDKEREIIQALFSQDQHQLKVEIQNMVKYTKSLNPMNINMAHRLYLEFIYIIMGHLYQKDIFAEDIFKKDINFMEHIIKYETLDEMNGYLEHILLSIFDEISHRNENVSSKIRRAKEYMKQFYHEDITLKSVSKHIQVSEAYLSRLFSSETGESFISYLTRLRIEAAMDLLKTSQLTIQQISEHIGYANPEHFSRIFKKNVGCSPNKFRNEMFSKNE